MYSVAASDHSQKPALTTPSGALARDSKPLLRFSRGPGGARGNDKNPHNQIAGYASSMRCHLALAQTTPQGIALLKPPPGFD
jgi:hypothetical protein